MPILPFKNIEYVVYEHTKEGRLVAIEKERSKEVSKFFKCYKSKKIKPSNKVLGYWFILDEEYNSLKIDFSKEVKVEVRELKIFPLK